MVKILNIEVSSGRFILRIFEGLFIAGLILFFFYYFPTPLAEIAGRFVSITPSEAQQISNAGASIASSPLPIIGVLLALLAFINAIIRGTWLYGAILVLTGFFWITFDLYLYFEGLLFANLFPSTIQQSQIPPQYQVYFSPATITTALTIVIILFMISSLVTIGLAHMPELPYNGTCNCATNSGPS